MRLSVHMNQMAEELNVKRDVTQANFRVLSKQLLSSLYHTVCLREVVATVKQQSYTFHEMQLFL